MPVFAQMKKSHAWLMRPLEELFIHRRRIHMNGTADSLEDQFGALKIFTQTDFTKFSQVYSDDDMDIAAAVNKVPLGVKIPCTFSSPSSTGEFVLLIRRCVFPVGAFSPPGASALVLVLLNIQTSSLMGLRGLLGYEMGSSRENCKQTAENDFISRKMFHFPFVES